MDDPGRRRLLAALASAASLGGCSSLTGGSPPEDDPTLTPAPLPSSSPTPSTDEPGRVPTRGDWTGRVDLLTLRTVDRTVAVHPRPAEQIDLAVGARFREHQNGPPVLGVALRNRSEEPLSLPAAAPLGPGDTVGRRRRGDGRLLLRPTGGRAAAHRERGGCWRSATGARTDEPPGTDTRSPGSATVDRDTPIPRGARATGFTPVEGGTRLEPGGAVERDYWVLAPAAGPCLPTGLYGVGTAVDWTFTLGVWRTSAPGPDGTSSFVGRDRPPLPVRGRAAWFHDATAATAVYLDPASERVAAPATARLVLRNHTPEPLVGNPAAYELLKLVDGDWYSIAPGAVPTPSGRLAPGDHQPWTLALSNGPSRPDADGIRIPHLGGGDYAFRVGLAREGSPRVHAALLRLDAPRSRLAPTPDLRVTDERDGELVVTSGRAGPDPTPVVATRSTAPNEEVVIREQLMQSRGLRNTIGVLATRETAHVRLLTGRSVAKGLVRGTRRRLRLRTRDGLIGYELRRAQS